MGSRCDGLAEGVGNADCAGGVHEVGDLGGVGPADGDGLGAVPGSQGVTSSKDAKVSSTTPAMPTKNSSRLCAVIRVKGFSGELTA